MPSRPLEARRHFQTRAAPRAASGLFDISLLSTTGRKRHALGTREDRKVVQTGVEASV
jgi:hypothetical protein